MMNPNSFVAANDHKEVNPVFRSSFADFKTAVNNPVPIQGLGSQLNHNASRLTAQMTPELPQAVLSGDQEKLLEKAQVTLKFYTKWSRVINKSVNDITR